MTTVSRREFLKLAGAGGVVTTAGLAGWGIAHAGKGGHVVVIGGGFGGAAAAKYIKKFDPNIQVTLVEPKKEFATCPSSNWVIGGFKPMSFILHKYDTLASKYDIKVVHDTVTDIDPAGKKVKLKGGDSMSYDRLIVSPGIDFRWDQVEGYDAKVAEEIPHAWNAGPQTVALRKQLEAMPDGGLFVITPPPNPFRCPPGPAERVSLVANYFKNNKPKSKILALDPKGKFSKEGLFRQGWTELYGFGTDKSMIEYVKGPDARLIAVDAKNKTVVVGDVEEEHKADVLNVIPPQQAGAIAQKAGLSDESGWCPVDHKTWESKQHKNIHVIGDAAIQAPMPKSGYAANSEAKVCAAMVVALLTGKELPIPSWINTCYSLVGPKYGISVAMVYELTDEGVVGKVKGAGGLTPKDGNRVLEALYAESWYANIIDDMLG